MKVRHGFGLISPIIQETFQSKIATSIVARLAIGSTGIRLVAHCPRPTYSAHTACTKQITPLRFALFLRFSGTDRRRDILPIALGQTSEVKWYVSTLELTAGFV